jgi:hypothetical protein
MCHVEFNRQLKSEGEAPDGVDQTSVMHYLYRLGWREWRSELPCLSSSRSLRRLAALVVVEEALCGGTEARGLGVSANCWVCPGNPEGGC